MIEILFENREDEKYPALVFVTDSIKNLDAAGLSAEEKNMVACVAERTNFEDKSGTILEVETCLRKIVLPILDSSASKEEMRLAGGRIYRRLKKVPSAQIMCADAANAYEIAFGILLGSYSFDKYMTTRPQADFPLLEKVVISAPDAANEGFEPYKALAAGVRYARDLTNEPANNMTPAIMAEDIKRLEYLGLKVDVLDEEIMRQKEFNLALSVAQGSCNKPRVAVITWNGKPQGTEFDLGLVGKGVTFDSGGISLKPGAGMWDMKQDMAGAAAVVAAMKTAALQKLPLNVVAVVGLVENMPSGSATRPGDIVRSMSGQTVEILNTDAEGRLVLADCLWYIQQTYGVKKVIDIATLTGAIMVALGKEMAGVMGNNQKFVDIICKAGEESGEKVWQLPLNKSYDKMMDSTIADMKNISESRNAGSITAACFLQRYIQKDVKWAHLDIAGMDKEEKGTILTPKGASGFGVRLFNQIMKTL